MKITSFSGTMVTSANNTFLVEVRKVMIIEIVTSITKALLVTDAIAKQFLDQNY